MSERLQSEHHPDADQLSAFVEHALPPHEQEQTLAHLAICPGCRSIVSLSLPAIEESPKLQPESAGRPWFFGWNLVWPAAAALAGLALFLIHIHNAAVTQTSVATPTQMATSHPPEPLPVPTTPAAPVSGKTSSLSFETQSRRAGSLAAKGASGSSSQKTEAGIRSQNTVISGQNVDRLSTQSRERAELKQSQPTSSSVAAESGLHGSIGGNAGLMEGFGATAHQNTTVLDGLQQSASGVSQAIKAPAPPPPPAAADAAPVRATNQTVDVAAGAAPVAALSSTSNRSVSQEASLLAQHPLPSRLPGLSIVSTTFQTVAIDTQNAVFFSDDGGRHWKAVSPPWQGRAVKVDLASSASNVPPPSNFAALGGPILSHSKVTDSALAGIVTDPTGAVIPDASIVISNAITQNIRTVKTDQTGRYLVDNLVPGNYQVEAQAPGFIAQQVAVTVTASQQSMANLTLPVGQAAETVTVNVPAKPLATHSLAKKKARAPQSDAMHPLTLFEITTDTGDHWTSVDGQNWMRK